MSNPKLNASRSQSQNLVKSPSLNSPSASIPHIVDVDDEECSVTPDFIYGGPFIKVEKPCPFMDTATPINLQLQGTFKKSFAYYSLKERMPVILTKVIDYLSREGSKIPGAVDSDVKGLIKHISKMKNDLITNKKYSLLKANTSDAKKWNEWIENAESKYYFTNTWVFTECYVYRSLRDGCEIHKSLQNFDPFASQKAESFKNSLEPMCLVADKLVTMLPPSEKDKRKADFITLIKTCLWANKCDLSLSVGEQVTLKGNKAESGDKTKVNAVESAILDPFQMIIDLKDKILVDDSGKAVDQIIAKAEAMMKAIEGGSPEPAPAAPAAEGEEAAEEPKIPCPAKMTIPQAVMFDIVCDNAGYELFSDLCIAHFLISQKIVQKIRFHVKKIPWFVSDVTPNDFTYLIEQCKNASYSKSIPQETKPAADAAENEAPPEPKMIGPDNLHELGNQWAAFVEDGTFIIMCDEFWTSPHVYKDMKKYDYNLYRKLQYAVGILFKGDLNYRKLLGEKNCNPIVGFEPSLQGFIPAPILALRTVKADLICGLPKGKWQQLTNLDEKWMQKGDYGVIQFCGKAEALKIADRPCLDYGEECRGTTCPIHTDI